MSKLSKWNSDNIWQVWHRVGTVLNHAEGDLETALTVLKLARHRSLLQLDLMNEIAAHVDEPMCSNGVGEALLGAVRDVLNAGELSHLEMRAQVLDHFDALALAVLHKAAKEGIAHTTSIGEDLVPTSGARRKKS